MWKAVLTVTLLSLAPGLGQAQGNPALEDRLALKPFDVDYAAFRDSASGNLRVVVFYKVFSASLSFQKWGDKFKADYTVDITINRKGKQVTGSSIDGNFVADDYKMSKSKEDFVINEIVFSLRPDDYQLVAKLRVPNSGESHEPVKVDMPLKQFQEEAPGFSTLEFAREASYALDDSQFVQQGMRVIPSVSRVYGDQEPVLIIYYEIYNKPSFAGDYFATYQILKDDKPVSMDSALFTSAGAVTPHVERIGVDDLLPAEYDIVVNVTSPGAKLHLKTKDFFKIGWSVKGLVKNDYKTAVEQLRYIATPEQMKKLADAPVEDRIRLWDEYWKSKDPTPGTPENELKDEYYKRLRYADINFGNFGRNGWKTDMGMVYVTYGPPDEIERHPFELDSKPYQVWYYYGLKRIFTFVDVNGYGDYELIYPYDGDPRKIR